MTEEMGVRNSAASFEEMVCRNRGLIWHVCSDYSLGMGWRVEDCVQEALCRLWQDYSQLQQPEKERAWVYKVTVRTMLMLRRSRQNRPVATFPPEELQQMEPAAEEHPEEENYRCLLQLIDALPEKQSLLIRAHLDGFSHKEIARMTGGTATGVAMQISRIRKKLKQWYEAEERPVRSSRPDIHQ